MAKPFTYTATFPTGQVITRKSHRPYSAAWLLVYRNRDGAAQQMSGFSRTEQLAQAAVTTEASRASKWGGSIDFAGFVPVVAS